jgi:hypothetical protein
MNDFVFTTTPRVFVRFLEEIEVNKKTFRNKLTFKQRQKIIHANIDEKRIYQQLNNSKGKTFFRRSLKVTNSPQSYKNIIPTSFIREADTKIAEQFLNHKLTPLFFSINSF